MEIFHRFSLEAARRLPHLPPEHPCARLHGHSFHIEVRVGGSLDPLLGWVCDFAIIETACNALRTELDHRILNDIAGLENPTSEHLAIWLWTRLKPQLAGLTEVRIQETDRAGCLYRGE